MSALAAIPVVGVPLALAAGAAIAGGIIKQVAKMKSVSDFKSGPGGITTMMGPAGVFSLNPRDSVLATTNPIPVNDLASGTSFGGVDAEAIGKAISANMQVRTAVDKREQAIIIEGATNPIGGVL